MKQTLSNKWKYTIKIKHLLTDEETTPELTETLCLSVIKQLTAITHRIKESNLTEDEKYYLEDKVTEVISNFEFLKDLANGTIAESEWDNFEFDGDFQDWGNYYLNDLYDIADERVLTKTNVLEKFMWIG